MKLTIEIPDDAIEEVRIAFSIQNQPATDEELAGQVLEMIAGRTQRVHMSFSIAEARQSSEELRKKLLPNEAAPDIAEAAVEAER